jgi:flagellar basal body rod protein FlgG
MGNGIYVALSGAVAQGDALDVTAHNVANAQTIGYHAERVRFSQALGRAQGNEMMFVTAKGGKTDTSEGAMKVTESPLDLALAGDAYFAIDTPRGVRYTRAGAFKLDAEGTIVNADGFAARAQGGGAITIPPGTQAIAVGESGIVTADGVEVGALELSRFVPNALTREGAQLLIARGPSAPIAEGEVRVVSGALEQANFNVVRGVMDLVRISRNYEALHRMIESYREIDSRTARDVGGPA